MALTTTIHHSNHNNNETNYHNDNGKGNWIAEAEAAIDAGDSGQRYLSDAN